MTAFERAIWEKKPQYLGKLGFDPRSDDVERLYEVAYRVEEVEALAKVQPPVDWQPITERILDGALFRLHLGLCSGGSAKWDLKRILGLSGSLRSLSDLTSRRLRRHLKSLGPDESRGWLRLLQQHMDPTGYLHLIGHPTFIEGYRDWGLKKDHIEELARGSVGSKAAAAKARRVLKEDRDRPPRIQTPWNRADHVRITREELYELVCSQYSSTLILLPFSSAHPQRDG